MLDVSLGKIYYIKDGKTLIEDATVSSENLDRQKVPGFSRRVTLYSDRELLTNNKNLTDIYKQYLDGNYTIIRALHPGISDMGKINILPEYDVNIYIPYRPSLGDIDKLKEVLDKYKEEKEFAFKIYNDCKSNYDLYDYGYNYSDNQRSVSGICEYFYKEKLLMLNPYEQEMFNKYRNFDLNSLMLEDYYKYVLNNRNTAVVIITPDEVIKKAVTKSFHKREIENTLGYKMNPNLSYNELTSDCNLVIGFITKGVIIVYLDININEFQQEALKSFVNDVNDVKQIKESLIANVNVVRDGVTIYEGELADVIPYLEENKKRQL